MNSEEKICGWVLGYNVYSLPAANLWLISLGWSFAVLLGSETKVIASSESEIMVQIGVIVLGFLIGSYVVSKVLSIIQQINHEAQSFKEKMKAINRFMVSRNVPMSLQFKVKRYLEFQYMVRSSGDDNLVLLDGVSPWLKYELTAHLHKKIICRHRFYRALPSEVINRVCAIAKTYLYATGDVVVQRGEVALRMFFIVRGRLRVVHEGLPKDAPPPPTIVMEPPQWIGDTCMFQSMVRMKSIVAITHAELLTIFKSDVLQELTRFPESMQYYLYDQCIFKNDFKVFGIKIVCNQ